MQVGSRKAEEVRLPFCLLGWSGWLQAVTGFPLFSAIASWCLRGVGGLSRDWSPVYKIRPWAAGRW